MAVQLELSGTLCHEYTIGGAALTLETFETTRRSQSIVEEIGVHRCSVQYSGRSNDWLAIKKKITMSFGFRKEELL